MSLDEGFLLVVQKFFDALVVLIEPVLMGFLLWPNGQLGRLLNCSHAHCGVEDPDSGPCAVSLSSKSFATKRLRSSCFSFAESTAGLQDSQS